MKHIVLLLAVSLFFVGFGNEHESESVAATVQGNSPVEHDLIAVRIDGKDLTRSEVMRDGKVVLMLNMNKSRKTKIRRREVQAIENYCKSAVNRAIATSAVAKYLEDKNLAVPESAVKHETRNFELRFGAMSRKLRRRHNVDDLKYMLKDQAWRLDRMILETARYDVMTNDIAQTADIVITDDMVENRIAKIKVLNDNALATNACIFAKATNIWQKIVSGELSFEEAADKFSEDEYIKEGCDWGTFTIDQLEGEDNVLALLPSINTGDITPPVESDGGLAILRKDEDDNNKTYSFSRVFFKLPYFFYEESPSEARDALRAEKIAELIKATMKEYSDKLKIEYPDGTNISWKVTAQDLK